MADRSAERRGEEVLANRVVLVTGSSRGIGAAIARLFAERGARVALHGRDAQALASIQAEIEGGGGRAISVRADVTRLAEIEAMRHEIEERLGPVDVLVANAGGTFSPPRPVEELDEAGWHASVDENLTATFLTMTILTERNEQRIPAASRDPLVEAHPLKRLGTPEDVARAALFLASEESAWITGAILDVSGGAVMVT
jgi:NAD(P)-dependent dehydrogenase (short-subunit alcohol dehydrogenase family)